MGIASDKRNNSYTVFLMVVLIGIAHILGNILIESIYSQTYVGACRPLFPHPLWAWSTALASAFIALFLLKIFKIKNQALNLFIALHLYLLVHTLLKCYVDPNYLGLNFYEAFYFLYLSKKTLLFSVTLLCLSVL